MWEIKGFHYSPLETFRNEKFERILHNKTIYNISDIQRVNPLSSMLYNQGSIQERGVRGGRPPPEYC